LFLDMVEKKRQLINLFLITVARFTTPSMF